MGLLSSHAPEGLPEREARRIKLISSVAATAISLACGTNYVYSAWAPQYGEKLKLSSTEINLIGTFGNLGMYASGIPVGLLVDSKGPRPGVFFGGALIGIGYMGLYKAYDGGEGYIPLAFQCLFAFFTGCGGAGAFAGSIKTSALNWPESRGTATAFPLSAFGLSALFFAFLSTVAFPNNTSSFLLLLSVGTFCMIMISNFLLRVVPHPRSYRSIPHERRGSEDNRLHQTRSGNSRHREPRLLQEPAPDSDADETSSLMSSTSKANDIDEDDVKTDSAAHDPHTLDIRGFAMLPTVEFWQLFSMLGLLTGIGLMTINNIGNDAQALWAHYDDQVDPAWIQRRQLTHVMLLSFMSFSGRLLSGIGSDLIVKKLGMSRFWCLFISSAIFCIAQVCGAKIENPNYLFFVSGTTGLAYGFLFGVYPSLVAETFGVHGLSQNWGWMTLAPVISGNIFNLLYGRIYDSHSNIDHDGHRQCLQGIRCYRTAYWVTFGASLAGVLVALWSIRWNNWREKNGLAFTSIRGKKKIVEREA